MLLSWLLWFKLLLSTLSFSLLEAERGLKDFVLSIYMTLLTGIEMRWVRSRVQELERMNRHASFFIRSLGSNFAAPNHGLVAR